MAIGIDKGKLIDQAQKHLQKGQIDRAIAEYQKIVEADPKDLRTRLKIGDLYLKMGNGKAAIDEYMNVAESYTSDGFNLQAIAVYKQLLKIAPSLYDIYIKLADLYKKQGLIADALIQYKAVMSNYEKQGKLGEALDTLKKMASIDPENFSMRAKLADLYLKSGNKKEALEEYSRLADDLDKKGRLNDAIILYQRMLAADPTYTQALRNLGKAYLKAGKKREAISEFKAAIEKDPGDTKALLLLARVYADSEDLGKAKQIYERILEIDPSSSDARKEISRIFIKDGDYNAGFNTLAPVIDKALEEKNYDIALGALFEFYRNGIKEPHVLEKMAEIYALKGEEEKAREIKAELVDVYEARGDTGKAGTLRTKLEMDALEEVEEVTEELPIEEHLVSPEEAAKEAPPSDVSRYLTEADIYIKYGLKDKAIEILNSARDLFPKDREINKRLASIGVSLPEEISLEVEAPKAKEIPKLEIVEEPKEGYSVSRVKDDLEEADFYIQQGLYDEARGICNRILEFYPENEGALLKLKAIEDAVHALVPAVELPAEEAHGEGFFDLAAELESEDIEGLSMVPGMREAERFGFEDIFSEFKKGLETQLGKEDTETHYNLGIAYKEMGLLDDAIREFLIASSDPNKEFDCYSLIGICYIEKGDPKKAVDIFKKGIEISGKNDEEYASMYYELGRAYELLGVAPDALSAYMEAKKKSPGFRDVESRILSLGGEAKKRRISYV